MLSKYQCTLEPRHRPSISFDHIHLTRWHFVIHWGFHYYYSLLLQPSMDLAVGKRKDSPNSGEERVLRSFSLPERHVHKIIRRLTNLKRSKRPLVLRDKCGLIH